jgi:hypothetical protein
MYIQKRKKICLVGRLSKNPLLSIDSKSINLCEKKMHLKRKKGVKGSNDTQKAGVRQQSYPGGWCKRR